MCKSDLFLQERYANFVFGIIKEVMQTEEKSCLMLLKWKESRDCLMLFHFIYLLFSGFLSHSFILWPLRRRGAQGLDFMRASKFKEKN
jgi:hypothetical protein